MSRYNGLLDAIFLPPRNWVLNEKLTFKAEITEEEKKKIKSLWCRYFTNTRR